MRAESQPIKLLGAIALLVSCGISQAIEPVSGYKFLRSETQAMQDDPFANPGMTAVDRGHSLFSKPGFNDKSCASCHGENGEKLDPERIAQYPVYSAKLGKPLTLRNQINLCYEERMDNFPMLYYCREMTELEAFVRNKAKGETVNVDISGPMQSHYESGKALYNQPFGLANMSCSQCHDQHTGKNLRGQTLTQGQSNGFPEYRLGSGKMTSLHARFTECFRSFRALPFDAGSEEYVDLEVFVNARGNGLKIETPAVRY